MRTILTIAGVAYASSDRAAARFAQMSWTGGTEGYDSLTFTLLGCGPRVPFGQGQRVTLSTFASDDVTPVPPPPAVPGAGSNLITPGLDGFLAFGFGDQGTPASSFTPTPAVPGGTGGPVAPALDGFLSFGLGDAGTPASSPTLRFVGEVVSCQQQEADTGWAWAFRCLGLKWLADLCTLTARDGTGTASYNRSPNDDPNYLIADAGLPVGEIIRLILESPANAAQLSGYGVGAYTSLSPPTLPAETLADLALMQVVPPEPVALGGPTLLGQIEQMAARWQPQHASRVRPDGVIRFQSIFALPVKTLTLPTTGGDAADPVFGLNHTRSTEGCFTRLQILGVDLQTAFLSLADGTLLPAWTPTQQANWTINDFVQPRDSTDEGDCSAVVSDGCTVRSDHAAAHWDANFWNLRQGTIQLFYPAGVGLELFETRQITACGPLAPGGTASIAWDSANPLSANNYTRYRILGQNSPLAEVGRLFDVAEPSTHKRGRETYVGARMVGHNPKGFMWGNNTHVVQDFYPAGVVLWSSGGQYPYIEWPITIRINPNTGQIDLSKPAVSLTAAYSQLLLGYPANFFQGLYADIRVAVPYNRGSIAAIDPASGYSGTAYTRYGIERTRTIHIDSFTFAGDTASMAQLAHEHLVTLQDEVVEGSLSHHGIPAGFDPFDVGYALRVRVEGRAGPLDDDVLPVREVTIDWPNEGPDLHTVTFSFSNRKRPFEGDSLYLHPAFAAGRGMEDGVMVVGNLGGMTGMMGLGEYNAVARELGALGRGPEDRFEGPKDRFPGAGDRFEGAGDRFEGAGDRFRGPAGVFDDGAGRFDDPRSRPGAEEQGDGEVRRDDPAEHVMDGWRPGRKAKADPANTRGRERKKQQEETAKQARESRRPTGPPEPSPTEMAGRNRKEAIEAHDIEVRARKKAREDFRKQNARRARERQANRPPPSSQAHNLGDVPVTPVEDVSPPPPPPEGPRLSERRGFRQPDDTDSGG